MWIIIVTGVPVALALYGLARLQHIRSSHGAQGPTSSVFTHENPALRRSANILQTAEEREAEVYKYRVKWDSDEESEPDSAPPLPIDVDTSVEKPKRKANQADVKWDEFEEK